MRVRTGVVTGALAGLALAAAALPTVALAAVDAYLQLDGFTGGSTDARHKGWIEVESFKLSETNPTTTGSAGRATGRATQSQIVVTLRADATSPKLMQASANGQHFATATLQVTRPDGAVAMTYELRDVLISGYQTGGSGAGAVTPQATMTLVYAQMKVDTTSQGPGATPQGWGAATTATTAQPVWH